MTFQNFYNEICELPNNYNNRDLEEYLLAVLNLVNERKDSEITALGILNIFQTSFSLEPTKFNRNWLIITNPPEFKSINSSHTGLEFTIAVLKFQIAELHKMKNKQLNNDLRYFGIDSETANRWYNFDPFTNLECGVSCLINRSEDQNSVFSAKWESIGEILEMGRIYE